MLQCGIMGARVLLNDKQWAWRSAATRAEGLLGAPEDAVLECGSPIGDRPWWLLLRRAMVSGGHGLYPKAVSARHFLPAPFYDAKKWGYRVNGNELALCAVHLINTIRNVFYECPAIQ